MVIKLSNKEMSASSCDYISSYAKKNCLRNFQPGKRHTLLAEKKAGYWLGILEPSSNEVIIHLKGTFSSGNNSTIKI